MANYLCPLASFMQVLVDAGNAPVPNCLIWTYLAGTSTPTATFTDITGGTPNSNPIQLNAAGRLNNVSIWQPGGVALKIQFSTNAGTVGAPVFGVQIGPTFDQVSGIDDPAALLTTLINPASGSGADLIANAMRSYDLIASVRAANVPSLAAGQTLIIDIEGGTIINDGGGGLFYWNATSTAVDDGINTIKPTAAGATGRYLRLTVPSGTSGSFTQTLTGCTTSPIVTVNYSLSGGPSNGVVTFDLVGNSGTSNSTSFGLNGWASGLRGTNNSVITPLFSATDNGSAVAAYMTIPNAIGGNPIIVINNASGLWTNSGTKGIVSFFGSYVLK